MTFYSTATWTQQKNHPKMFELTKITAWLRSSQEGFYIAYIHVYFQDMSTNR